MGRSVKAVYVLVANIIKISHILKGPGVWVLIIIFIDFELQFLDVFERTVSNYFDAPLFFKVVLFKGGVEILLIEAGLSLFLLTIFDLVLQLELQLRLLNPWFKSNYIRARIKWINVLLSWAFTFWGYWGYWGYWAYWGYYYCCC